MVGNVRTPDEIWAGDLFGRRDDAETLIAYIESVCQRPIVREDSRAYTIAVDSGYGEGKSFFLRRLAEHLAINHPVAFVDAWSDDIADEPLTALAATLKKALGPLIERPGPIQDRWRGVMQKTGKVAWLASKGLLRRGLTLALTAGAVEGIDQVIDGVSDATEEAIQDGVKEIGKEMPGELAKVSSLAAPSDLMAQRIAEFEAGAAAIRDLKESLAALVSALEELGQHPPIVIVIDELDRCRPTYSVKLLEEIKHLFDVPGIVFLFGMHGEQLSHSIAAAYGTNFDGTAYLRRFINRKYVLSEPNLTPLLDVLLKQAGLTEQQLVFPMVKTENGAARFSAAEMIAMYMDVYGLKPRDAFYIVDLLQTCSALTQGARLLASYLVPLAIGTYLGKASGELPNAVRGALHQLVVYDEGFRGDQRLAQVENWAGNIGALARTEARELMRLANSGNDPATAIFEITANGNGNRNPLVSPANYPELLRKVGRFLNPALGEETAGKAQE